MAVGVQKAWSTTASSNGSADTNVNFAEGQLAPTLNNSSRAAMAAIKGWANQIAGGCTCAGSSNAYTITSDAAAAISSAYGAGMMFMLKANHTNTGAATLNVDSVGAVAIKTSDGGDVVAGDIVSGGLYLLAYNATGPRFDLIGTFAGGSFQPLDATLTAVAGLSFSTTNAFFRATDVDTFVAESASNFRSALSLGTAALATIGTSGDTVPKNNTANTNSAVQTYTANTPIVLQSDQAAFHFKEGGGSDRFLLGIRSDISGNDTDFLLYSLGVGTVFQVPQSTRVVDFKAGPTINGVAIITGSSPTLSSPTLSGTVAGSPTASGSWTFPNLTIDANGFSRVVHKDGGTAIWSTGLRADNDPNYYIYQESGSGIVSIASDVVASAVGPTSVYSLGYRGAPIGNGGSAANSAYTFVLADAGCTVYHDEVTARTYTIPANSSVAYPVGTVIVIDNTGNSGSAGTITLQITTDTLRRGDGVSGTGSRTIAASSVAAVRKVASTVWVITGSFT